MQYLVEFLVRGEAFHVGIDQMEARIVHVGEIFRQAGPEIVDDDQCLHIVAQQQSLDDVGADKPGAARNQYLLAHT